MLRQRFYSFRRLFISRRLYEDSRNEFIVRPAVSAEDFKFVTELCREDGFLSVGAHMLSHVGPVIKPGVFMGYLNGKRIGQVGVCKFGEGKDGYSFIGLYVVDKPFRGKGYGSKIRNVMWESLGKDWNIGLDAVPDMVPKYERMGFSPKWVETEFVVSCSKVIQSLQKVMISSDQSIELINIKTEPIDQVDFDKLLAYDTSVFGFPRREFLQKWITIPNSFGLAVTNKDEDIVGYAIMQYSVLEKHQIIGPLFSDDNNVTRLLLSSLAKVAIDIKGAECLRLTVPVGVNPCAAEIMEKEIGYDSFLELKRMYSKGVPAKGCMSKVVAITTPTIE